MPRRLLLAATLIISSSMVVVAHGATPPTYKELAKQPTPLAWADPLVWPFTITGRDNQRELLTLHFANEPVQVCGAGAWKRATIVGTSISNPPLERWHAAKSEGGDGLSAAYEIVGRNLSVVLNAPACDNKWVLRGTLSETGATGWFATEGPRGGEMLGTFATALEPKLFLAHELQMPIEQEPLQRQYAALSTMRLRNLEYSASGPVAFLRGDTGIVLPGSIRALKKGDLATGVVALFKDILLAEGSEVFRVERTDQDASELQLTQTVRGIPVYEGGIDFTYDPATLQVSSLHAHFVPDRGLPLVPRLSADNAEQIAIEAMNSRDRTPGAAVERLGGTHLAYRLDAFTYPAQRPDGSRPPPAPRIAPRLVWVVSVAKEWTEIHVVDANTGKIVASRSMKPTIGLASPTNKPNS